MATEIGLSDGIYEPLFPPATHIAEMHVLGKILAPLAPVVAAALVAIAFVVALPLTPIISMFGIGALSRAMVKSDQPH